MLSYDIVGDIHGHADELEALLRRLGYVATGVGFRPPQGRQLIFVGDLIDRGPAQLRTLDIARDMLNEGHARCLMGNHEFNAIGYLTPDPDNPGEFLRPHAGSHAVCRKNKAQHEAFIAQLGEGSARHREWVEWFRSLPLSLDLGGIRVVHASWHDDSINAIRQAASDPDAPMRSEAFFHACHADPALEAARLRLTCGLEWPLPAGLSIVDKAGHHHADVRIADWRHRATRLRELALVPAGNEDTVPDIAIPEAIRPQAVTGPPVFIGHHWFHGRPHVEYDRHLCLDWSVARPGGRLVAYRWDGEQQLVDAHLEWVDRGDPS